MSNNTIYGKLFGGNLILRIAVGIAAGRSRWNRSPVICAVMHEVVGPHVVGILGSRAPSAIRIQVVVGFILSSQVDGAICA